MPFISLCRDQFPALIKHEMVVETNAVNVLLLPHLCSAVGMIVVVMRSACELKLSNNSWGIWGRSCRGCYECLIGCNLSFTIYRYVYDSDYEIDNLISLFSVLFFFSFSFLSSYIVAIASRIVLVILKTVIPTIKWWVYYLLLLKFSRV